MTKRWHGRFTVDYVDGVQKFHTLPTPRVGGIAIGVAILAYLIGFSDANSILVIYAVIASIPLVLAGTIEDISNLVNAKIRLLFSLLSGLIFVVLSGYHVTDIQLIGLNRLLAFAPLSILVTSIALAGISNAINIIDGYHGLASGAVVIMFATLSLFGYWQNDHMLFIFSAVHFSATLGFFCVNYPRGRIFLGDGGAYYLGFALGANVVMLFERNPSISPWTASLILAYPLIETLFSIWRKTKRLGYRADRPDGVHLHMLVYRSFARKLGKKLGASAEKTNPIAGSIMWAFPIFSCFLATAGFFLPPIYSKLFFVIFIFVYLAIYRRVSLQNYVKKAR